MMDVLSIIGLLGSIASIVGIWLTYRQVKAVKSVAEATRDATCFYEHDEGYEDLKAIYEAAHNNYMQIDETLKSMFDDLNNRL